MRLFLVSLGLFLGCSGAPSVSQSETAKRTYEAEQAACVVTYPTAPEIDACRATVRRLWGQPARGPASSPGPAPWSPGDGGIARDGGF